MYATLILAVSVVPVDSRLAPGHLDKVAHLGEYLLFAWLLLRALRETSSRPPRAGWVAWATATGYGLAIELIQAWVPWRSAEVADAVMNALGAALGVWVGSRLTHHPSLTTRHGYH